MTVRQMGPNAFIQTRYVVLACLSSTGPTTVEIHMANFSGSLTINFDSPAEARHYLEDLRNQIEREERA